MHSCKIFGLLLSLAVLSSCDIGNEAQSERSSLKDIPAGNTGDTIKDKPETVVPGKACEGGIVDGVAESKVFYKNPSEVFGGTCQKETRTRKCENGSFKEWSGTFTAEACTVAGPASCTGTAGPVPSGSSEQRIAYAVASVPAGQNCPSPQLQSRLCTNGTFGNWTGGTGTHASCTVQGAIACTGSATKLAFKKDPVAYNETCESEIRERTCKPDGTWTAFSGSFTFAKCDKTPAAPCGSVAHDGQENRTCFATATVPAGATCVGSDHVRTCKNGNWQPWSTVSCPSLTCSVNAPTTSTRNELLKSRDMVFYSNLGDAIPGATTNVLSVPAKLSGGRTTSGTAGNTARVAGVEAPGLALHFDSQDHLRFNVGTEVLDYSGITISSWVRSVATGNWDCIARTTNPAECVASKDRGDVIYTIISAFDYDTPYSGFTMGTGLDDVFACRFKDFTSRSAGTSTTEKVPKGPDHGVWIHLTCSYDRAAKKIRLYINGDLKKESTANLDSINPSGADVNVAHSVFHQGQFRDIWHGAIAELSIFSRPLTNAEVKILATPPHPEDE